jgi:hypothetical protein
MGPGNPFGSSRTRSSVMICAKTSVLRVLACEKKICEAHLRSLNCTILDYTSLTNTKDGQESCEEHLKEDQY